MIPKQVLKRVLQGPEHEPGVGPSETGLRVYILASRYKNLTLWTVCEAWITAEQLALRTDPEI